MNDAMLDAEGQRWFRSVKANLEHFGGVEVFMDASVRDCACCLEPLNTVYRIRPQKCRHVFHVECLLQWWSEGTCPVCSVSFAPQEGDEKWSSSLMNGKLTPHANVESQKS